MFLLLLCSCSLFPNQELRKYLVSNLCMNTEKVKTDLKVVCLNSKSVKILVEFDIKIEEINP